MFCTGWNCEFYLNRWEVPEPLGGLFFTAPIHEGNGLL